MLPAYRFEVRVADIKPVRRIWETSEMLLLPRAIEWPDGLGELSLPQYVPTRRRLSITFRGNGNGAYIRENCYAANEPRWCRAYGRCQAKIRGLQSKRKTYMTVKCTISQCNLFKEKTRTVVVTVSHLWDTVPVNMTSGHDSS